MAGCSAEGAIADIDQFAAVRHPGTMLTRHSPTISDFVDDWHSSLFGAVTSLPWEATQQAERLINDQIAHLDKEYEVSGTVAVHVTATVENGAVIKGPAIIGPNALVAAHAYLRGGVFVAKDCILGPSCELKTTFMFSGAKVAHLSFVGDSIIGSRANIEAGAIIANYRNELEDKLIRIELDGQVIETGVEKFGALIGDDAKVGANAVIAPGALIDKKSIVRRGSLLDHSPNC